MSLCSLCTCVWMCELESEELGSQLSVRAYLCARGGNGFDVTWQSAKYVVTAGTQGYCQ